MEITKPAVATLRRLRFSQKFALIGSIAIVPIGLLTYFFFVEVNSGVSFATNEKKGVTVLKPTYRLLSNLASLRSATIRQADTESLRKSGNELLNGLNGLGKSEGASLKVDKELKAVSDSASKVFSSNSATSAEIDAAMDTVSTLIGAIGNNSQLVLDPDIDSYYTMDTVIVQAESMLVRLASTRDLMSTVVAKSKTISPTDRTKLTVLQTQIDTPFATFQSDIDQASNFNPAVKAGLGQARADVVEKAQAFDGLLQKGFVTGDQINAKPGEVKAGGDELQKSIDAYFDKAVDQLNNLLTIRQDGYIHRRNTVLSVVAFCIFLTAYLFVALYRGIRQSANEISGQLISLKDRTLKDIGNAMKALAEGNLTVEVDSHAEKLCELSRDEIGDMVRTFNGMTDITNESIEAYNVARAAVADVISEIMENATMVASRSYMLSESAHSSSVAAHEIAEGSEKLAIHATETAAIMEEFAAQVSTVQDSSVHQQSLVEEAVLSLAEADSGITGVTSSVRDMNHAAAQGNSAVAETISMMERVQSRVNDSAAKVEALAEKSKEIDIIVKSIKEIADQTNLLALNAAIEAARAGESGRGFAVVADEVRKLAEQTGQATEQITGLIQGVSAMVRDAVESIEGTTVEVKQGYERTQFAAETLDQIVVTSSEVATRSEKLAQLTIGAIDAIRKLSESATDNANASEEMAVAANRVAASITDVAAVSEEASAGAEELSSTIRNVNGIATGLNEMSTTLDALMARFQVESSKPDLRIAA